LMWMDERTGDGGGSEDVVEGDGLVVLAYDVGIGAGPGRLWGTVAALGRWSAFGDVVVAVGR